MANLKSFSELKKGILIEPGDYWLNAEGLEIWYLFNEKEIALVANIEQAAELLEAMGIIESYHFENNCHWVRVEVEIEGAKAKTVAIEWEQFILSYNLAQSEAIDLAAWHEGNIQLHQIAKGGRK